MSNAQLEALKAARDAEEITVLVDLDDAQLEALMELDVYNKRNEIASAAFAAALRGKVQSMADKAIKAKYIADSKNRPAVAEECEKEIQTWIRLKQRLG